MKLLMLFHRCLFLGALAVSFMLGAANAAKQDIINDSYSSALIKIPIASLSDVNIRM